MPDAPRWRALDGLRIRAWDDEYVCHNDLSGNTHLLGPLPGRALELLCARNAALTAAEIVASLAHAERIAPGEELALAVDRALDEFERHGLVDRLPE